MYVEILLKNEGTTFRYFYCDAKPEFQEKLDKFLEQAEEEGLI